MSLPTERVLGRRCVGALAACGCSQPVAASGSPGAEGMVLVVFLLPVAIYFARAWFAEETQVSPAERAGRNARIDALCMAVDAR